MPGECVDGQDVLAVRSAAERAIDRARSGKGPTLLECRTYRYVGHHEGDRRLETIGPRRRSRIGRNVTADSNGNSLLELGAPRRDRRYPPGSRNRNRDCR